MKANIHPTWYPDARVICACGNTFTTGSTKPEIRVEICSKCHPFFTGSKKLVDTLGQVQKFQARQAATAQIPPKKKGKKKGQKQTEQPQSLKEMLAMIQGK